MRNDLDRFHLVIDVCNQIELGNCDGVDQETRWSAVYVRQEMYQKLVKHREYINEFGVDLDEVANWEWSSQLGHSRPSFFKNM